MQDDLGAIDYLCIVAKVALLVQKEDNIYMSRLRDTDNPSSQIKFCGEGKIFVLGT